MARKARVGFRMRGRVPELRHVSKELAIRAMPRVVKVAEEHVKEVAPKKRGYSDSKSIVRRIKGRVEKEGEVGIVAAKAPHSHLIELGVKAHSLAGGAHRDPERKGRRKKIGANLMIYGNPNIIRKGAWHPGIAARPFMQKGLDQAGGDISQVLQDEAYKAFESKMRDVTELFR